MRAELLSSQFRAVKDCYISRMKHIRIYLSYVVSGLGITALAMGSGLLSSLGKSLVLVTTWLFLVAFVYVFNDLFDMEADRVNDRKLPLADGRVGKAQVIGISIMSLFIALAISFSLNIGLFLVSVAFAILGVLYSAPPVRLKKRGVGKPLTIAFALALSILAGGVSLGVMTGELLYLCLCFGILAMFGYPSADLKDLKGDKKQGIVTIPHMIGEKRTLELAIIGYFVILGLAVLGTVYFGFSLFLIPLVGVVSFVNIWSLYRESLQKSTEREYIKISKRSAISFTLLPLIFLIAFV